MRKGVWMAGFIAGLLVFSPNVGLADLESEYYEAPGVSTLSNKGKGWDLSDMILGEGSSVDFGGWVAFGLTTGQTGLFNGGASTDDGSTEDQFANTQSWVYLEKSMDTSEGFDWGGRFDAMYGLDAADTQAFGNHTDRWDFDNGLDHGPYGFAFPQLYLELGYKDWSIKGGHFYTLVGYEVVPAPDNFFFSHAFTMYNSEPFTHTGFYATYSGYDKFELYAGWTAGWDTAFDRYDGGSNFLGGGSYAASDEVSITYILTGGNFGRIGNGYGHSVVVDTTPLARTGVLTKLNYVLQSDVLTTNDSVGVNQYLLYPLCDLLGLGIRGEWWRTEGADYGGLTGGVNIALLPNLKIRPEGRYQWGPSGNGNKAGLPTDKGMFAFDMILTF